MTVMMPAYAVVVSRLSANERIGNCRCLRGHGPPRWVRRLVVVDGMHEEVVPCLQVRVPKSVDTVDMPLGSETAVPRLGLVRKDDIMMAAERVQWAACSSYTDQAKPVAA